MLKTKTGLEIQLRKPTMGDLEVLCDYINTLSKEQTFIGYQGEEITLETERTYLEKRLKDIEEHKAVNLLAFHNEILIGNCDIKMKTLVASHRGSLGISVAKEYREQGIGTILIEEILKEGKQWIPNLEIVELTVYSPNERAFNLYTKIGFAEFGRLEKGAKLPSGYADVIYMKLNLNDSGC